MKHLLIFILLTTLTYRAASQNKVFYSGVFPEMAVTFSISNVISATTKIESQHGLIYKENNSPMENEYFHDRTDLQGFINYKLNPFWKLAVGYQYRFNERDVDNQRSIQQISYVNRALGINLGHRLRFDQTYEPNEANLYRARYRIGAELPLQGSSLDFNELYLLISNELIYASQSASDDLENRFVTSVGKLLNSKIKVEAGIDYRTDRILIDNSKRNRLWFKFGTFITI